MKQFVRRRAQPRTAKRFAVRRAPAAGALAMRAEARQRLAGASALTIGGVNDPAEKAADRIADHVMRAPAAQTGSVRRMCADCAEEQPEKRSDTVRRQHAPDPQHDKKSRRRKRGAKNKGELENAIKLLEKIFKEKSRRKQLKLMRQLKPLPPIENKLERLDVEDPPLNLKLLERHMQELKQERDSLDARPLSRAAAAEPVVRAKSMSDGGKGGGPASPATAKAVASMGPGHPMATAERAFFEPRFGADFSAVRLHDDALAHRAARAMDARAFALGGDVAFARGERREGAAGRRLMAHELAHVVQGSAVEQPRRQAKAKGTPVAGPFEEFKLEFNAFIPGSMGTWLDEPGGWRCLFKTDERNVGEAGTSRIHDFGTFNVSSEGIRNCKAASTIGQSEVKCREYLGLGDYGAVQKETAVSKGNETATCGKCNASFQFVGEAAYPFSAVAPDIDFDVKADVTIASGSISVSFTGTHNMFPAYEAIVERQGIRDVVYQFDPPATGPGLINLNTSKTISGSPNWWGLLKEAPSC
jgi:hypothetical protein